VAVLPSHRLWRQLDVAVIHLDYDSATANRGSTSFALSLLALRNTSKALICSNFLFASLERYDTYQKLVSKLSFT
jgi:hypothetical protein